MTDLSYGVRYAPDPVSPIPGDEPAPNPQPVTDYETARNFLTIHPTAQAVVVRDTTAGVWRETEETTR